MRQPFRHQMPGYSPVPLSSVLLGWGSLLRSGEGDRERVVSLLSRVYGASAVRLTGSGTEALQLAIAEALKRVDTTAVAIPAFCCYDMATAAVAGEGKIALYDLDPATLAPDLESLERLFRQGVRVAVIAPLYGVPVAWDELDRLALSYGAVLIEDAAQGHGASWRGRRLGSLGALSVLSFGRGKGWTGGSGGALLTRGSDVEPDDAPASGRASDEVMNLCGISAQWLLARPNLYGIPMSLPSLGLGETHYRDPSPPRSIECSALAILLRTYNTSEHEAERRRVHAAELLAELRDNPRIDVIRVPQDTIPGYHRLPVRVKAGWHTVSDMARARRLGLGASYPSTLAVLPAIAARLMGVEHAWPGAEQLVRELVTVPTHSRTTRNGRREIVKILRLARP